MPIKPGQRDGKGEFPEPSGKHKKLDETLIDKTISNASSRVVIVDLVYMVFVGFLKTLSGFFSFGSDSDIDNKGV